MEEKKQKKIKTILISEGAEAKIYLDKKNSIIIKERIKKNYRHKILDEKIVFSRTKKEYSILKKLEEKIKKTKRKFFFNKTINYEKNIIILEYIRGEELKKSLKEKKLIVELAKKIFLLHENKIIHGDITPKNVLKTKKGLYFIDFGLSFYSERLEDKIYDLYMTKETFSEDFYKILLEEYKKLYKKKYKEKNKLLMLEERIKRIEERGKNKKKQNTKKT